MKSALLKIQLQWMTSKIQQRGNNNNHLPQWHTKSMVLNIYEVTQLYFRLTFTNIIKNDWEKKPVTEKQNSHAETEKN